MKFLVVVLVVAVVGWLLLRSRSRSRSGAVRRRAAPTQAQAMVACQHCGVHLPRGDAVEDARGVFCSEAHRLAGPRPR